MLSFKKNSDVMKSFFDSEYKMAEIIRNMQKQTRKMSQKEIEEDYNRRCADIERYR